MLVLSRRANDQILIPSLGITLEVLSIKGNVVKLGIDAPQNVRVMRGELLEKQAEPTEPEEDSTSSETQEPTLPSPSNLSGSPLRSYLNKGTKRGSEATRIASGLSGKVCVAEAGRESVKESRATYEVCV